MKPTSSRFIHWKLAATAGLLFIAGNVAQAQDLTYTLKRDLRLGVVSTVPESRRIPAMRRVELGLTPYVFENRNPALYRHDELTSHVLAVHIRRVAGELAIYPGHSLAPNLSRIVSR